MGSYYNHNTILPPYNSAKVILWLWLWYTICSTHLILQQPCEVGKTSIITSLPYMRKLSLKELQEFAQDQVVSKKLQSWAYSPWLLTSNPAFVCFLNQIRQWFCLAPMSNDRRDSLVGLVISEDRAGFPHRQTAPDDNRLTQVQGETRMQLARCALLTLQGNGTP